MKVGIIGVDTPLGKQFAGFYKKWFNPPRLMTAIWKDWRGCIAILEKCDIVFFIPRSHEEIEKYFQTALKFFIPIGGSPMWIDFGKKGKPCFDVNSIADLISLRFDPTEGENPFGGACVDLMTSGSVINDQGIVWLSGFVAEAVKPDGKLEIKDSGRKKARFPMFY